MCRRDRAKGEGDITDWLFDESRQPGDTAVLESSGGYHVVYYIGQDEPYWKVQVESAKRSEDYNNAYTELEEKYPVVEHAFGRGLRSEPFREIEGKKLVQNKQQRLL